MKYFFAAMATMAIALAFQGYIGKSELPQVSPSVDAQLTSQTTSLSPTNQVVTHHDRAAKTASPAAEPLDVELISINDKVGKKGSLQLIRHFWEVEFFNDTNEVIQVYIEVEWLDAKGNRVAKKRDHGYFDPGKNSHTGIGFLDRIEHSKARMFRVYQIVEHQRVSGVKPRSARFDMTTHVN